MIPEKPSLVDPQSSDGNAELEKKSINGGARSNA